MRQGVRDDTACSYAPSNSPEYYACRHDLVVARAQASAQTPPPDIGGSMQQAGAWLQAGAAPGPPMVPMTPMPPPPRPTTCNFFRNQMVCQ